MSRLTAIVTGAIMQARKKQDDEWVTQDYNDPQWLRLLTEKLGDATKASLADDTKSQPYLYHTEYELIQAAAVIVAWLECRVRYYADPEDPTVKRDPEAWLKRVMRE